MGNKGSRKAGTILDATLELGDGDPLLWVARKDHAKDLIQLL